jgi:NHL repeat-containing protein
MQGSSGDGGPAVAARLHGPLSVAVDGAGNLYIAEFGSLYGDVGNRVRKVGPDGIISTVAGIAGAGGFSGDGGPAIGAMLDHPGGVAVDTAGNLFIADWRNNRVRKVDPAGIISTVAGDGSVRFSGEGGPATAAGLRLSFGDVAVDAMGDLFFSDTGYDRSDGQGPDERILKVVGVAAPGLIAGMTFPR